LPTLKEPLLFQAEPAPLIVTKPLLGGFLPIVLPKLPKLPSVKTLPPFVIVRVPVPSPPIATVPECVHKDPTPLTVTAPFEPGLSPTVELVAETRPPSTMFKRPVPKNPTTQ
jgi:hypothetical protein